MAGHGCKIGRRRRLGGVAALVLAPALCGCAGRGPSALAASATPAETGAVADVSERSPLAGGTAEVWTADPARLAADVRRALRDLHWGRMALSSDANPGGGPQTVEAAALLPDGRTAMIVAGPAGPRLVSVRVQVGLLGDGQEERRFITMLKRLLAGKPGPVRGGSFRLP